jgi:hypothetical protein
MEERIHTGEPDASKVARPVREEAIDHPFSFSMRGLGGRLHTGDGGTCS